MNEQRCSLCLHEHPEHQHCLVREVDEARAELSLSLARERELRKTLADITLCHQEDRREWLAREQRLREENERLKRLLKQRGKDAADAEDLEAWYQQALRAIEGPSDDWLWMGPYRAAGGGYEGLQAIASFALSSVPEGEGE